MSVTESLVVDGGTGIVPHQSDQRCRPRSGRDRTKAGREVRRFTVASRGSCRVTSYRAGIDQDRRANSPVTTRPPELEHDRPPRLMIPKMPLARKSVPPSRCRAVAEEGRVVETRRYPGSNSTVTVPVRKARRKPVAIGVAEARRSRIRGVVSEIENRPGPVVVLVGARDLE